MSIKNHIKREQRIEKYNAGRPTYQAVPKAESLKRTAKDRKICANLEEAIKPLLNNPDDSHKLVRQSPEWLKKKQKFFNQQT